MNDAHQIHECQVVRDGIHRSGIHQLDTYVFHGGYDALRLAVGYLTPQEIIQMVAESELSGRGGAGFSAGRKWATVAAADGTPVVVVNGDESEPGSFKDRELMEKLPHRIIEGALIAAHAVGADEVILFVRNEYRLATQRLEAALEELRQAHLPGQVPMHVHISAGAYICGEETALIEALEGNRPIPREKPPYPAELGYQGRPTLVNNVETLANIPAIISRGPEWFRHLGVPGAAGTRVFSISGQVRRPGNYESELGVPLLGLIEELGGGVHPGRAIKAVVPGGTSSPVLSGLSLGIRMTPHALKEVGSSLGTASVIVYDDTTCMVDAAANMSRFYRDESCGKCTPCRDGTQLLFEILSRIETGKGSAEDLERLTQICDYIPWGSVCALGIGAVAPVRSTLKQFHAEYLAHVREGRCPIRQDRQTARRHRTKAGAPSP
ncbi:MAG: NADH-quinone oxidoreductase subunit F [Leptospirillia bacterium]